LIRMVVSKLTAQFIASMPAAYTHAFAEADAEEHAQIVFSRGSELAKVVTWRSLPQGVAILCVVTEDRPGLVALVSSAFLAHALDVRAAQIYCRTCADGRLEAVDFFWLKTAASGVPLEASRLDACGRTILELLSADPARIEVGAAQPHKDTRAKLEFAKDTATTDAWEVSLEAQDFPGLLHTVARLLHQHGLEVVRCEIRTEDGVAKDRFIVTTFTGAPAERSLAAFQSSLLGVIQAQARQ
jgi:UTP:GlnB (protein PII) uridylyltransferase